MERENNELADHQIEGIIEDATVVHVGIMDGTAPYIVAFPFGYIFKDGKLTLYLYSAPEGRVIDSIKKDRNVFIEIGTDCSLSPLNENIRNKCNSVYMNIWGNGTAEIVEDVKEKVFGLERIMQAKFGENVPIPEYMTISDDMTEDVSVIKISVPQINAESNF